MTDQLRSEAYSIPGLGTASLREESSGNDTGDMRPLRWGLYVNGNAL